MLVHWLGVLMLAYSVVNSQHASNSNGDVAPTSQHVKQSAEINQTDNNDTLSLIKELLSRRRLEHRNNESATPKRVKITYRRRSTISNKDESDNPDNDRSKLDTVTKTKHEYLKHPLDSKEAELLPLLLEYLDNSDKENSGHALKDTRRSDFSKHEENKTEIKNEKEESAKNHLNRRGWSLVVLNNKKHKPNGAENDVISTMQYGNVHTGEGQSDVITGNGAYTRYHQKIVPYKGYGDYFRGGNNIMYHLEHNSEDSDDNESVGSRTVQKQELDSSKVEERVKKLCANAKTNLLEFWKVAAGYFGLDNKKLSDKQKMDLFLTILRSVDGTKQAESLSLNPEEIKSASKISLAKNAADFYWSNENKAEQQFQEPRLEEKVVFTDQQQHSQKEFNYRLDSQDFSLLNEDVVVKPVFDVVSRDKIFFNKEGEENSLDLSEPEKTERELKATSEKEDLNETEKTNLKPEFELDKQPDDRRTDEEDTSINHNDDSNVENFIKSKEYVTTPNPKFVKLDVGSSRIENEDVENVLDEVTLGPYIYRHNDKLSSGGSNAPISKENVSSDDSHATPVTENNNGFVEQSKEITDSEFVTKELTESKQPGKDKIPSEDVANANKDHEFEIFGLDDSDEFSEQRTPNKLSLLLTLLRALPKGKRARILLLMKALKAQHNNSHQVEGLKDTFDANNSSSELESLLKDLKGEPKDKLAEILLHFMAKKNAHPKLLVKYKVALKSKGQAEGEGSKEDLSDQSESDDSGSKNNDSDEEKRRPKLHLKWNVHLKPKNEINGLLFQIISKFNQLGISDEALQEINSDLERALIETDEIKGCQTKVLNEKIYAIKNSFQKLLNLRKEADASSENDQ